MNNLNSSKLFLSDYLVENGIPCRPTYNNAIVIEKFGLLCGAEMSALTVEIKKLNANDLFIAIKRLEERVSVVEKFSAIDLFFCIHKKKTTEKKKAKKKFTHKDNFWLELRYQALKNNNGACCLCGMTAKDGIKLHVDHIKPKSLFPDLEYEITNLQVLCDKCNIGKSNKDDTDWR